MRIAVVHSFYSSSEPSGENSTVLAQVGSLQDAGFDAKLISRSTDEESRKSFYRLKAAAAAAGIAGPSPHEQMIDFEPDVIHVHNLFPNYGTRWARHAVAPIVATAHNYRPLCSSATLFREGATCTDCVTSGSHNALIHRCYRGSGLATAPLAWATRQQGSHNVMLQSVARLITLNGYATSIYASVFGAHKVVEIPNFVSPMSKPGSEASSRTWSEVEFAYLGRLTSEKGISWLLQHWPKDRRLTIAGSGPLKEAVCDAVADSPNLSFVGRLDPADAYGLIAAAQAVVIPSLWSEGLPTVALEALSVGTPIVISNRVGSVRQLTSDASGVGYDPDRGTEGLIAALREVDGDHSNRRFKALEKFRSCYSEPVWLDNILTLYRAVIAERELQIEPRRQQS